MQFSAIELINQSLFDRLYQRAITATAEEWWRENKSVEWRITLDPKTFEECPITQQVIDEFGDANRMYIQRLEARSFYTWHIDYSRNAAINMGLNAFDLGCTMYGEMEHRHFRNLQPLNYVPRAMFLVDTTKHHCGTNFSDHDRFLVTISVIRPHTFNDVMQFVSECK